MTRAHIFYSGQVQGVGFRFTFQRYALQLGVFGWVRNLPDGRVEAVIEGEKSSLETLMSQMESYFEDYIREKQITFSEENQEFKEFRIAF